MQINFYQTNDLIHKSIAPILTKILEDGKRALIFSKNQELLNQIDEGLWSFSKTKFIPHGLAQEEIPPLKQPILLTKEPKNLNAANYLIMLDKTDDDFVADFEKVFYFFGDQNLAPAKDLWRYYKSKSATLNFYKKEQDKWVAA